MSAQVPVALVPLAAASRPPPQQQRDHGGWDLRAVPGPAAVRVTQRPAPPVEGELPPEAPAGSSGAVCDLWALAAFAAAGPWAAEGAWRQRWSWACLPTWQAGRQQRRSCRLRRSMHGCSGCVGSRAPSCGGA